MRVNRVFCCALLSCLGCASADSKDTQSQLEAAPGVQCDTLHQTFAACGGDLEGDFELNGRCDFEKTTEIPCGTLKMDHESWAGGLRFDGGDFTAVMQHEKRYTLSFDMTCDTSGKDEVDACREMAAPWADEVANCSLTDHVCSCEANISELKRLTAAYRVEGHMVYFTDQRYSDSDKTLIDRSARFCLQSGKLYIAEEGERYWAFTPVTSLEE